MITKKLKFILLLFFTSFSCLLFGQFKFKPGYYINNNNDTIHGLIAYNDDVINSMLCTYKQNENSAKKKFYPGEIIGYRFNNSKFFISKEIETEDGPKKLFLEFLLNGIIDLYFYRDAKDHNSHYYIEKDGKLIEMTNKDVEVRIEDKGNFVKSSNKYIGILKYTFSDCDEIQNDIEETKLDHLSLIEISKKYHDYVCNGEECIIYEKKDRFLKTKTTMYLGFSYANIRFSDYYSYRDANFDKSFSPSVGMSVLAIKPEYSENIGVLFGAEVQKDHFKGTSPNETIDLKSTFLTIYGGPSFTYSKNSIAPSIAFGGTINRFFKGDIRITDERTSSTSLTMDLPTACLGGFAQFDCGFTINNKVVLHSRIRYDFSKGNIPWGKSKAYFSWINFSLGVSFIKPKKQ